MPLDEEHEAGFVDAFVVKAKRERIRQFLPDSRQRGKVMATLASHTPDLDDRFMTKVPPRQQTPAAVERLLRQRNAPDDCYAISPEDELDGTTAPLSDLLKQVVGTSNGTVLSCVPGRLAYYEGHEFGARYVLERHGGPTRS